MFLSICVCVYTCPSKCVCVFLLTCKRAWTLKHMSLLYMGVRRKQCMYCTPVCLFHISTLYACVCLHACVHAFMLACMCYMSKYVCVSTHTHRQTRYKCVCVHLALSDLPPGLYGPNQMVGNINFTIPSPHLSPPPSPPLSLNNFSPLLPLLPSSSSPFPLHPSSVSCSLWRCDYVPPLSTSDLRVQCVYVCVHLHVCVWWLVGDLSNPALGIVQHNSRTTSPDECLHSQLQPFHLLQPSLPCCCLLLLLLLCKKKKKKKQLKQDKNKLEHKQCTWKKKKKNSKGRCVGVCVGRWFFSRGSHYLSFIPEKSLPDLFEHSRMNAISSKRLTQGLSVGYIFLIFLLFCYCACLIISPLKGSDFLHKHRKLRKPV